MQNMRLNTLLKSSEKSEPIIERFHMVPGGESPCEPLLSEQTDV